MFRQKYADLPVFDGLDASQIATISPYLDEVSYRAGEVIFEQGQKAEHLYIVLEGEVLVRYKPYDGPPIIVSRIPTGGVFGWSAALGRGEYTSACVASMDCMIYRMRKDNLQRLCETNPTTGHLLLERLAGGIAERMRNTHVSLLDILVQGIDSGTNSTKRNRNGKTEPTRSGQK
ncbi:MAG: cyclic nucleotide-binding domain-containing protein [Anaerolineae bacterium]|nr:cyclic nucleotide-binding domain-containing protein [Anaerolineae bacterium]